MFVIISPARRFCPRPGDFEPDSERRGPVRRRAAGLPRQIRRVGPIGWRLLVVLVCAACSRPEKPAPTEAQAARDASAEKRYELRGRIIAVNRERGTLTVSHEAIAGLMPAMTMEFQVSAGDLDIAKPEQPIRGELVRDGGDFRLEKVWPDDRVSVSSVAAAANALRQDTAARGKGAYREIGENLPEFALYDQDGRLVEARRFRGRQIMLNFIYSRCPVATMCPAATLRMMAVQKQARAAGVKNLELVSITLDPVNDTPGVLKDYAAARGIDTSNFSFLTGPESAIRDLLTQFGVIAQFQDGLLKHTLATLLIDEQGRIIHRADGSDWLVDEFVEKMRKQEGP
jgi:protein SCO1/2